MNNRNGNGRLHATPKLPDHVPPIYRDNRSNVIVGGSCDGLRADTPQNQQLIELQAPPPDLEKSIRTPDLSQSEKVVKTPPAERYRWAQINAVNGKALNGQILVDLIDRFWFRVPENMTDGDAIKLLVSNYLKLPED